MKLLITTAFITFLNLMSTAVSKQKVLTQDQLLWFVENFHPSSFKANLIIAQGESALKAANGSFDPTISTNLNDKYYDNKSYYYLLNAGLSIPTKLGVDFKTGYSQNSGSFLNPENVAPNNGLIHAGVSVKLGKGMFIDKRRAALKQAAIFSQSTEIEQQNIMNNLYFKAIKQYWNWVKAWNQYLVYEESFSIAEMRLKAVKSGYNIGESPSIDTLEAYLQMQTRKNVKNQQFLLYQNETLALSNFLWFEEFTPLIIEDSLVPPDLTDFSLSGNVIAYNPQELITKVAQQNPELKLYKYSLVDMEIERKLKAEALKPTINLNYNMLTEPVGNGNTDLINVNNYKFGFDINMPLFLRTARGNLQVVNQKIRNIELDQMNKTYQIQNQVLAYYNGQQNLRSQIQVLTENVTGYNSLLNAEKKKFSIGESSLFLIFSRENSLISSRLKLIAVITKYEETKNGLKWGVGELYSSN